jgi:Zn-dependent protease with chaperone function
MTTIEFEQLINKIEPLAKAQPTAYKWRVIGLTLLGDLFLWTILLILLSCMAFAAFYAVQLKFVAIKVLIVLLPVVWILLRALYVKLPPPEGIKLTREMAPDLFAMIDRVQVALQAPRFDVVLIDDRFNAAVTQIPRLGVFGWFKNYLILGLPLMKTLSPIQLQAVIAHEYGHLAGGHAKLSNWIYRQRQRWERLLNGFEANGSETAGAFFAKFVRWYSPLLNAYSFPMARANEYEADAASAKVGDAKALGTALTAVHVMNQYYHERYWPAVHAQASLVASPNATPHASYTSKLAADLDSLPVAHWLEGAVSVKTSFDDTHPALTDRLAALGIAAELALPVAEHAADQLLGDSLANITATVDQQWQAAVSQTWAAQYESAQANRQQFEALNARFDAGEELSLPEATQRAIFIDEVGGDINRSIAELGRLHKEHPEDMTLGIALGSRLLHNKDEAGVPILLALADKHSGLAAHCTMLIFQYHAHNDRPEEAKEYALRLQHIEEVRLLAEAEREATLGTDQFVSHGLSADMIADLQTTLRKERALESVFIVKKLCVHQADQDFWVVGYTVTGVALWARDEKLATAVNAIQQALRLPGDGRILPLYKEHAFLVARFKAIDGAQLL